MIKPVIEIRDSSLKAGRDLRVVLDSSIRFEIDGIITDELAGGCRVVKDRDSDLPLGVNCFAPYPNTVTKKFFGKK